MGVGRLQRPGDVERVERRAGRQHRQGPANVGLRDMAVLFDAHGLQPEGHQPEDHRGRGDLLRRHHGAVKGVAAFHQRGLQRPGGGLDPCQALPGAEKRRQDPVGQPRGERVVALDHEFSHLERQFGRRLF